MQLSFVPLRHNAFLATAFVAILAASFASRVTAVMGLYLAIAFCVVLANVRIFGTATQREQNVALVTVLIVCVMLPISLLKSETAVIHFVVVLLSLGAGFVLSRDVKVYVTASKLTLIAAQLYVIQFLARHGLKNFPLQDIIPDSSSNGVTSYMVLLQANYCIVNYAYTRRTSLFTAMVTLAICIVGFGRGSILAATAILAVGVGCRVWLAGRGRATLVVLATFVAGVVLAVHFAEQIEIFVNSNTKIGSGLFDAHRYSMINEYLAKIDAVTLWTGASYTGTSIVSEYNNNPHNSFIRAHYIFGLPYLALLFAMPVYLIHKAHSGSVKVYSAALWVVVMFRCSTEPILFPTLLDFFYFAVCFILARDPGRDAALADRDPHPA